MELSQLLDKLKLDHLDHQLDAVCEQAAARDLAGTVKLTLMMSCTQP